MENKIVIQNKEYEKLIEAVGLELKKGRQNIAIAVNAEIVQTYWHIGKHIIQYEQNGNERAEYGSDLLNRLSHDLTQKYGSGFSRSNVFYIRKLYMEYPKVQTLSELSWSHYGEIQHEDIGQMNFYLNYYREEMNTEGDTKPIGIVLGAYQDKLVMQYALQNISNQVFTSRYQLYLPEREQLEAELQRFMNDNGETK